MLDHESPDAAHVGQQGPVAGLFNGLVKEPDHAGQQHHRAQHAHDHALAHDDTQVAAKGEAHEADGNEARNGGQAGA